MSAMSESEISPAGNSSGNDGARRARRFADAQRQMSGGPAHRHAEVPAARRFRIHHEVLHDADAGMTSGFVAERREREWEPQIVVDALGHLHDLHNGAALEGDGAAHQVVAANADQRVDLELGECGDRVLQALGVAGDVAARGAEEHAAIEVDARDLLNRQLVLFVGVALSEPVEAVIEADRHASDLDGFDGNRADDSVRPGCRTAADDDADAFDGHGCWAAGRSYGFIERGTRSADERRLASDGPRRPAGPPRQRERNPRSRVGSCRHGRLGIPRCWCPRGAPSSYLSLAP